MFPGESIPVHSSKTGQGQGKEIILFQSSLGKQWLYLGCFHDRGAEFVQRRICSSGRFKKPNPAWVTTHNSQYFLTNTGEAPLSFPILQNCLLPVCWSQDRGMALSLACEFCKLPSLLSFLLRRDFLQYRTKSHKAMANSVYCY